MIRKQLITTHHKASKNFNKFFTGGNLDTWLASLRGGDVCLVQADGSLTGSITNGGSAASRIYIDWGSHKITGRLDMRGGASYWDWYNFGHRDLTSFDTGGNQSCVIGGSYNVFDYFESINNHQKIGWEFIWDSTFGQAVGNTLSRGRIHQIGRIPLTQPNMTQYPSAALGSDNRWHLNNDHGIYDVGHQQHYVDLLIYDCADRGLQLRGAQNAHAEYFTIDSCGEGIIFGDIGADNCLCEHFIATGNIVESRFLIEEYDPNNVDSLNTVFHFDSWNSDGRSTIGSLHSVAQSSVLHVDPQYDSNIMAQNPLVAGMGCRVIPPVIF